MSGDRKTRRRFIADALFAGGALTAASMLGYSATHQQPVLPPQVVEEKHDLKPACTPREDMRPAGEMEAPVPAPSQVPVQQQPVPMHPGGAVAPQQLAPAPRPNK